MEILGMSGVSLQATLASLSGCDDIIEPHHPISCKGGLRYGTDGSLACDHAEVAPGDTRTQHCLNASVAMLLFEQLP
jgi:hypothetical protein